MSDNPFPQIDTSYSTLDVLVSDPSNPFGNTPGSDPSPVDSQHSNWNSSSDLFSQGQLLDGAWSQQHQQQPQSSADLFWSGSENTVRRPQGDFEMNNQFNNLDIQQAMAGIAAAAPPSLFPTTQNYQLPISSSISFDMNNPLSQHNYNYQPGPFGTQNQYDGNDQLNHALSRQTSYSSFASLSNDGFTSNSNEGLYNMSRATDYANQLLPPFQPTSSRLSKPTLPPIQVNAFSPPGKMGRPRSTSRIAPYNRQHRSTSISTVASFDSIAPMSACSTYAPFQAPSLASPQRGLAQGMGKMSLHHRRTSSKNSNYSTVKKQPSRSVLSRSSRSASMSVLRACDSAPFDSSNSSMGPGRGANATEDQIQASLHDKAKNVGRILSTTQQDKARTAWVRYWLQKAYTLTPNYSVSRQGLYHSYCLASEDYGLKPINAASFGKAVRAANPGIRTRRLGHRGNSKYHYVSLRPALAIEAERLNAYPDSNGQWYRDSCGSFGFRHHENAGSMGLLGEEGDDEEFGEHEEEEDDTLYPIKRSASTMSLSHTAHHRQSGSDDYTSRSGLIPPRMGMIRRHTTSAATSPPAPPSTTRVSDLPNFPQWDEILVACPNLPEGDLRSFWQGFEQHQQDLVECIDRLALDELERSCRHYWFPSQYAELCQDEELSEIVHRALAATYDHIIGMLLSSADSTNLSDLKSLSDLAGSFEETMEVAFSNFGVDFKADKLVLARNAAHLMQRVSEVGQVIAALSMITDGRASNLASAWHGLDLEHIVEQYMSSISCDSDWVQKALGEFGSWLDFLENMPGRQHRQAIRKMISWLDSVTAPFAEEGVLETLPAKCTFITSHIMRAFTLSSEPHFGTFQLIKTLIDDYITIAASRYSVFSPHAVDRELEEPLEGYNGGLKVDIPRFGDEAIDSDPATAVPAFNQQHQQLSAMNGQLDPSLFDGLMPTDDNRATFSYNDQQMLPQTEATKQFLPKHD